MYFPLVLGQACANVVDPNAASDQGLHGLLLIQYILRTSTGS